jgi:uncharacterized surface protein with fasciclin (FAS1) repeats
LYGELPSKFGVLVTSAANFFYTAAFLAIGSISTPFNIRRYNLSSKMNLVTALKAADLVATLKGKGPFTVFARLSKHSQKFRIMISTGRGEMVNNAEVVAVDVVADNGVSHAIDTVLMPK